MPDAPLAMLASASVVAGTAREDETARKCSRCHRPHHRITTCRQVLLELHAEHGISERLPLSRSGRKCTRCLKSGDHYASTCTADPPHPAVMVSSVPKTRKCKRCRTVGVHHERNCDADEPVVSVRTPQVRPTLRCVYCHEDHHGHDCDKREVIMASSHPC